MSERRAELGYVAKGMPDRQPRPPARIARNVLFGVAGLWAVATAVSVVVHGSREAELGGTAEPARPIERWATAGPPADQRSGDPQAMAEALRALGYLDAYEEAPEGGTDVVLHEPEHVQPGATLLVSSHAPEATVIDAAGRPLHRWRLPFEEAFPELPADPDDRRRFGWRRVHAFPDGELLAVFEGLGLLRVDRDSKLLWARAGGYHHDLDVSPDGRVHALFREVERLPRFHAERPFLVDYVHVLTPEGKLLESHSLLDALERSPWAPFLRRQGRTGDLLHTNALTWLDGRHADRVPGFARGNLLLSSLSLDLLFTLDPKRGAVPWALAGPWLAQHEPRLLANGRVLVFDNLGGRSGSRVLEVDPETHAIPWRYERAEPGAFASICCGTASRLGNGNTLVVESTRGRAFEVTPKGETVWLYQSPHRRGSDESLVAVLFDAVRLPPGFGAGWMPGAK